MSTGVLPMARGTCKHGLKLPSAAQVGYIAGCLAHKDWGSAVAVCIDWCDICTGLTNEPDSRKS